MDKTSRRNEIIQKKNERNSKVYIEVKPADTDRKEGQAVNVRINPDGDTRQTYLNERNQRPQKTKMYAAMTQPMNEVPTQRYSESLKELLNKRNRMVDTKPKVELKRIRERYTVKLKHATRTTSPANKDHVKIDNVKNGLKNALKVPLQIKAFNENIKKENKEPAHIKDKAHDTAQKSHTLPRVACNTTEKVSQQVKKPVIRTVITKNGSNKIYKAVAFKEQKEKRPPLQINIPIELKTFIRPDDSLKTSNSTKSSDVNSLKNKVTVNKINVDDKSVLARKCSRKRIKRHIKYHPSKESSVQDIKKCRSPSTEVAKWSPASVTSHTKPYYEAWVDTTLTAVSKNERMKLEKYKINNCLQISPEQMDTPELFYSKYADERFRGRIKIRQQQR